MDNNWTIEQTKKLFAYVKQAYNQGKGLKSAFLKASSESGKSVNSVRNYYYSQLKMFELVPSLAKDLGIETVKCTRVGFDLFTQDQIENLIRTILLNKAQGKSVRAIIASISSSPKEALRLQNKYRSMVAHNRQRVEEVMNKLSKENKVYFNPYFKQNVDGKEKNDNIMKFNDYISKLDPMEVGSFLNILTKLKV